MSEQLSMGSASFYVGGANREGNGADLFPYESHASFLEVTSLSFNTVGQMSVEYISFGNISLSAD